MNGDEYETSGILGPNEDGEPQEGAPYNPTAPPIEAAQVVKSTVMQPSGGVMVTPLTETPKLVTDKVKAEQERLGPEWRVWATPSGDIASVGPGYGGGGEPVSFDLRDTEAVQTTPGLFETDARGEYTPTARAKQEALGVTSAFVEPQSVTTVSKAPVSSIPLKVTSVSLQDGRYTATLYNELNGRGHTVEITKDTYDAIQKLGVSDSVLPYTFAQYKDLVDYEQSQVELTRFAESHILLPDGKWIAKDQWAEIPERWQKVGLVEGFDAMDEAIKAYVQSIKVAEATMAPYKQGEGFNLIKAVKDGVPASVMVLAGFESDDIDKAADVVKASEDTGVALPGTLNPYDRVSASDRAKMVAEGRWSDWEAASFDPTYNRRQGVEALSTMFFAPAKVLLPEVTLGDITPLDWAVGGAQLASWAIPFIPKGVVPLSAVTSGIFGANVAANWGQLSVGEQIAGISGSVLAALPLGISLGKNLIPIAVKIPVADGGAVTVWKGVSLAGKPVIGITRSAVLESGLFGESTPRIVVGQRGVALPKAESIAKGYRPITKVERTIMASDKATKQVGLDDIAIGRINTTLKIADYVKGKDSPYLTRTASPEAIKSLNSKSVAKVISESVDKSNKVEQVYGSMTIKQQLKPELKGWRTPGDIDIQTGLDKEGVIDFAKRLAKQLEATEGRGQVRIAPGEDRGLVQSKGPDGWRNAVDIHGKESISLEEIERAETLASISRATGDYSYGIRITEPSVTIKYPGIGKVEMMSLSESSTRKMDAILRWNKGVVEPPKFGAKPARIKDIFDLYVIAKTFKGGDITDELLAEYARLWGITAEDLARLAEEAPTKLGVFKFTPSEEGAAKGGSPTVSVNVPSYMAKTSPAISAALNSPTSLSGMASNSIAALASSPSKSISTSSYRVSSVKPSTSPSRGASPKSIMSSASMARGYSVAASPMSVSLPSPKYASAPKPSLSSSPSSPSSPPSPSAKPSPSPGKREPPSSPAPSSPSYPPYAPDTTPSKPPVIIRRGRSRAGIEEKYTQYGESDIAWKQGFGWWVGSPPYKTRADFRFTRDVPIGATTVKGIGSAYKTIQALSGIAPNFMLNLDMGAFDVKVQSPKTRGQRGAIRFKRDVKGRTTGDISLKAIG